jgi:hypothetical protein
MCDTSTYDLIQTLFVGSFALVGIMLSFAWLRGDIRVSWARQRT